MATSGFELVDVILDTLKQDSRTAGQEIGAMVSDGTVLLFGSCEQDCQARAAVSIAGRFDGVTDVLDRIARDDVALRKAA